MSNAFQRTADFVQHAVADDFEARTGRSRHRVTLVLVVEHLEPALTVGIAPFNYPRSESLVAYQVDLAKILPWPPTLLPPSGCGASEASDMLYQRELIAPPVLIVVHVVKSFTQQSMEVLECVSVVAL